MIAFLISEIVVYGWALMLFARNLSTTNLTPDLFVLISIVPVGLLLILGYSMRIAYTIKRKPVSTAEYPEPRVAQDLEATDCASLRQPLAFLYADLDPISR